MGEKGGGSADPLFQCGLPRDGVGKSCLQLPEDVRLKLLPQQSLRGSIQGRYVPAFAAEIQVLHAAPCQQGYPAVGKSFRRGHGPGGGKLHHQVGAAEHGHLRPGKFIQAGHAAPLDIVPAHGAHYRQAGIRFRLPQQPLMAQMHRIKFTHNAHSVHGSTPFVLILPHFCPAGNGCVAIGSKKRYNEQVI